MLVQREVEFGSRPLLKQRATNEYRSAPTIVKRLAGGRAAGRAHLPRLRRDDLLGPFGSGATVCLVSTSPKGKSALGRLLAIKL